MWWADIEVPNGLVDGNSRKPSACYPRRTFYLLSDDLSTKNHRITMADFRLCLIYKSYSQASMIAITLIK